MTDHAELRRLAEACDVSRCADEGEERRRLHDFYDCVEPELILDLLDEIDGMKASGWRNHSVNYARAEKCPQTLETAQAAWDRDQELIEEQRQQIARDSQTINQLRQKLQSAEVDRDRLKAENDALRGRSSHSPSSNESDRQWVGNAPKEGILYGVHSNTGSAELHVEHMQAAQSALEGATQ